jgi:tetratricopeptide (TPR) repeat protein
MASDFHTIFILRVKIPFWTASAQAAKRLVFCLLCTGPVSLAPAQSEAPAAEKAGAKVVDIGAEDGREAGTLPPLTQELAQRAAAAVSKRDWKAARAAYQEMVDADPANAPALANLGAVEYQLKDYDAAVGHLERALAAQPGLAQTWLTLGMVHYERDDPMRALSALSRAVAEKPDDPRAHNHLAAATKALGWLGAAEAELHRALDLDPGYAEAHFNLALIYLERRPPSIELARRHYLRSVELGTPRDDLVEKQLNEPDFEEINQPETSSAAPEPQTSSAEKPKASPKPASPSKTKPSPRSGSTSRRSPPER